MLKKLAFVLMVFSFMIAGAVVSMAGEDDELLNTRKSANGAVPEIVELKETGEEKYSHESVIEKYSSLFFDKESKTDVKYIKDIKIEDISSTKNDIQDYSFSAALAENNKVEPGNVFVLMFFIKDGDAYKLLCDPREIDPADCNMRLIELITLYLPNVGKNNPNEIRLIVFPKNKYKELSLDNIQIYDTTIFIVKQFNVKKTLKPLDDVLKSYMDILSK